MFRILIMLFALTLSACSMHQVKVTPHQEIVGDSASMVAVEQPTEAIEALAPDVMAADAAIPPSTSASALDTLVSDILLEQALAIAETPAPVMVDAKELECMSLNMYHEARGEGEKGMVAVGYVVLNRAASPNFKPSTACGVIYQGFTRKGKRRCQFSWTCDGKSDRVTNSTVYNLAVELSRQVLTRQVANPIGNSTFYYARWMKKPPKWAAAFAFHALVGTHRFYVASN